ncbi:hypothetical protein LXA43DRAFT_1011686, partial [Ganoderma leucocontextum]
MVVSPLPAAAACWVEGAVLDSMLALDRICSQPSSAICYSYITISCRKPRPLPCRARRVGSLNIPPLVLPRPIDALHEHPTHSVTTLPLPNPSILCASALRSHCDSFTPIRLHPMSCAPAARPAFNPSNSTTQVSDFPLFSGLKLPVMLADAIPLCSQTRAHPTAPASQHNVSPPGSRPLSPLATSQTRENIPLDRFWHTMCVCVARGSGAAIPVIRARAHPFS